MQNGDTKLYPHNTFEIGNWRMCEVAQLVRVFRNRHLRTRRRIWVLEKEVSNKRRDSDVTNLADPTLLVRTRVFQRDKGEKQEGVADQTTSL